MGSLSNRTTDERSNQSQSKVKYLYRCLGPSVILAGVSLGPSSLVNSVNMGANFGYSLIWWMVVICIFGVIFRTAMMRYTLVTGKPLLTGIGDTYGKFWGILCGTIGLLQSIIFGIGNYVGGGLAMSLLFPGMSQTVGGLIILAIAFIFLCMRDLYRKLERAMKAMLLAMLVAFVVILANVGNADPNVVPTELVKLPLNAAEIAMMMTMLGTTVSLSTSAYSTSLVREKGFNTEDIQRHGILADCSVGMFLMFAVSTLLILVGARAFGGNPIVNGQTFGIALADTIGPWARYVVGIGFVSIALSTLMMSMPCGVDQMLQGMGKPTGMKESTFKIQIIVTAIGFVIAIIVGGIFGRAPAQVLQVSAWGGIIATPLLGVFTITLCRRKEMGKYRISNINTGALVVAYLFIIWMVIQNIITQIGALR